MISLAEYDSLIESIIQQEKDIIGLVALTKARQVDGLEVEDDGSIKSMERNGEEVFKDLVESYKSLVGEAIATALRNYQSEEGDVPEDMEQAIKEFA